VSARAGCPGWHEAALSPPRAHGPPLPHAEFKSQPEDFRVEEELSFVPSGSGPHWLLRVEKRAANTRWVAGELARRVRVPVHNVGYAGLKDRQAVTVQWFSVPASPHMTADAWCGVRSDEFRVLDAHANGRKLKRGALVGNRFWIRLHHAAWSPEQLNLKLERIRELGVPNYFGPQRFGRDGRNLDRAAQWARTSQAPRGRTEREFALSASRSLLFNAVLARRVAAGDWCRLMPGDVASLDGSASHFGVSVLDEELQARLASFDIHPSGVLCGRGVPATQWEPLALEKAVAHEFTEVAQLLESVGLDQERRALRCAVRDLRAEVEAGTVTLSFRLGRGQYATAVLREICELKASPEFDSSAEVESSSDFDSRAD
jgi:tRNA pseudouridine13 synthase